MADLDGILENKDKDYGIGIPVKHESFFLKGLDHCDWGIKDRMSRIFNVKSGRTVMLAFDHGYIMGPTSGLERLDLGIVPLIEYADSIMCTRGALRSVVPPTSNKAVWPSLFGRDIRFNRAERRMYHRYRRCYPDQRFGFGCHGFYRGYL